MSAGGKQQTGYVTLLAVLVVGMASLVITTALLAGGVDSQRATLVYQQSAQARGLADACAEEALQQLWNEPVSSGSGSLTLGQGSCTYDITEVAQNNYQILSTSNIEDVVRKNEVHVTIDTSSLSIISWQEIN